MDLSQLIPSRLDVILWLLLYTVPSLLAIAWSRRVLLVGAAHAGRTVLAKILLALGVIAIGLVVLNLVYPHQHHNTVWIPSHLRLAYPIDVAIGAMVAICGLAAWILSRSRR